MRKVGLRIKNRIKEIAKLNDGWHDGEGAAPKSAALCQAENLANKIAAYIYPTLEGAIMVEWSIGPYEISAECDGENIAFHVVNTKEGSEV